MSTNIYPTRLNYYDGLFLQANDFTTEQTYGMQALSLHNQYIHKAYGIASGLTLSVAPNSVTNGSQSSTQYVIKVAAGFAQCLTSTDDLSSYCVGLYLPQEQSLTVPNDVAAAGTFYVAMSYQVLEQDTNVDKGPKPIHLVEQPKIECFSQYGDKTGNKAYVLLGKITTGNPADISYTDNAYIYDINQVFGIQFNTSTQQYGLRLNGTFNVSQGLSVGNPDAISAIPSSAMVKIQEGLYANTVTAKSQFSTEGMLTAQAGISTQGFLSAQTASITGDTLSVSQGTITAQNVVVNQTLTLNQDFSVQNQFTAAKGIVINHGNLEIKQGDITLEQGNIQVTGNITASADLAGQNLTLTGDVSAPHSSATFKSAQINQSLTAGTTVITDTLEIQGALSASKGVTLSGNVQLESELNATNITASGYINVDQNVTVSNTLTAQSLVATQGLTVDENIVANGNITTKGVLKAKSILVEEGFGHDQNLTAQALTSLTSLTSQNGTIIRDFYAGSQTQTNSLNINIPAIATALKNGAVMYRISVEGCSDLGPINSELSAMIKAGKQTKLQNPNNQNLTSGANVEQALSQGQVSITVTPPADNTIFQWLGVSVSVWVFTPTES